MTKILILLLRAMFRGRRWLIYVEHTGGDGGIGFSRELPMMRGPFLLHVEKSIAHLRRKVEHFPNARKGHP